MMKLLWMREVLYLKMEKSYKTIQDNVACIQDNIANIAIKAGRDPKEITLMGVTKTQSVGNVRALLKAGVTTIGENKVQELLDKEPYLQDISHSTHLIGHLQRNKVKYLPGHISMLQSLDSVKTLQTIEKIYGEKALTLDVLVEVNIGEEVSKTGVLQKELEPLVEYIENSSAVQLRGLMCIPPICEGDKVRRYFEQIYALFIDIKRKKRDNENINILSMGMSADYEYAIMEGSTMVRIGSSLFGPRNYS